jgi:hypothetical protein
VFRIHGLWCWVLRFRIYGLGFRVKGLGFRVPDFERRVSSSGLRA